MKRLLLCTILLFCATCNAKRPEGTTDGDCSDGIDNDGNGLIDCEDPGCRFDEHCRILAARARESAEKAHREAEAEKHAATNAHSDYIAMADLWVQRHHNGADVSQSEAESYCANLNLNNKDDWRLPTVEQAVRISESTQFPSEPLVMWTTAKTGNRGKIVGISSGAINQIGVNSRGQCRARCVRDNR